MTAALRVSEREGVVEIVLPAAAPIAEAEALALDLLGICAALNERIDPHRAVVLRGSPDAFFLATPVSAAESDSVAPYWAKVTSAVASLAPPTIAVVEGEAIGPAWELALACDLRVVADNAMLGSPDIRWGRIPSAGGVQRLIRAGGSAKALRLLLLGQSITGSEAAALGLVQRVAESGAIASTVDDLIASLGAAPIALAYVKEATIAAARVSLEDGLRLEADLAALLQTTTDRAEGLAAFHQKRPARFTGE